MADENAAQNTCCFISLLKNDQTELLQATEVSALPLLHKKNVDSPVASFGLPVTATITTHSNLILGQINVLSCDSLFTGINQRECLLLHPLGISSKEKVVFLVPRIVFLFLVDFFFSCNTNRNWFLSYNTVQTSEGFVGFFSFCNVT